MAGELVGPTAAEITAAKEAAAADARVRRALDFVAACQGVCKDNLAAGGTETLEAAYTVLKAYFEG